MRRKKTRMLTMNMRKRRCTRRRMSMTSRRMEAMQRRGVRGCGRGCRKRDEARWMGLAEQECEVRQRRKDDADDGGENANPDGRTEALIWTRTAEEQGGMWRREEGRGYETKRVNQNKTRRGYGDYMGTMGGGDVVGSVDEAR